MEFLSVELAHPCRESSRHLKYLKRGRPIRLTPSWQEFRAIIADIRNHPFNADAEDSADVVEAIGHPSRSNFHSTTSGIDD